jgi:hypothetical protein
MSATAAGTTPFVRREVHQSLEVRGVKFGRRRFAHLEYVMQMLSEHHTDGMNRLMSAEPFPLQSFDCFDNDLFPKGDLVWYAVTISNRSASGVSSQSVPIGATSGSYFFKVHRFWLNRADGSVSRGGS